MNMPNKTALMFVDETIIKIVIGDSLKCIKFEDIQASHNIKYIEQLFTKCHVLIVDKASELSKDDFTNWVAALVAVPVKATIADRVTTADKVEAKPAPKQIDPQHQTKRSAADILNEADDESEKYLYRSTDETTMTIDDLPTGEVMVIGTNPKTGEAVTTEKTLAIHPYKAIDLSRLPVENIKKSAILRRLIREGVLVPCSRKEALDMERRYDEKTRQDNDARLDAAAPLIDGSVESFVINNGGVANMFNSHDAETMDIVDDSPLDARKGEMSLTDLMKMSGAGDDEMPDVETIQDDDVPIAPKRQLAARPAVEKTGIKPKGSINRR